MEILCVLSYLYPCTDLNNNNEPFFYNSDSFDLKRILLYSVDLILILWFAFVRFGNKGFFKNPANSLPLSRHGAQDELDL